MARDYEYHFAMSDENILSTLTTAEMNPIIMPWTAGLRPIRCVHWIFLCFNLFVYNQSINQSITLYFSISLFHLLRMRTRLRVSAFARADLSTSLRPQSSVVRYPRYHDTYRRYQSYRYRRYLRDDTTAVYRSSKNIVRRRKYREYRDTVQVVGYHSATSAQVCDTETNFVTVKQWVTLAAVTIQFHISLQLVVFAQH